MGARVNKYYEDGLPQHLQHERGSLPKRDTEHHNPDIRRWYSVQSTINGVIVDSQLIRDI